jgi:hypothetical protein
MGNITAALKRTKLWDTTLLVWAADNGGPTGVGDVGPKAATCAANNYPLCVSTAPVRCHTACAYHCTRLQGSNNTTGTSSLTPTMFVMRTVYSLDVEAKARLSRAVYGLRHLCLVA